MHCLQWVYIVSSAHAASAIRCIDIKFCLNWAIFNIKCAYTHAHTDTLSHSKILVTGLIARTHTYSEETAFIDVCDKDMIDNGAVGGQCMNCYTLWAKSKAI